MVQKYKRKRLQEEMSLDVKPNKLGIKVEGSERVLAKQEIRNELDNLTDQSILNDQEYKGLKMNLKEKIEKNIWDNNLKEIFDFILEATKDPYSRNKWSWTRNGKCKYIDIRIDMRDGGFILSNREGERIDLETLKYQYKLDNKKENNK